MLILTRRMGETLVMDGKSEITVLGIKGNQVRIGVDAPKTTNVVRKELLEKDKINGNI